MSKIVETDLVESGSTLHFADKLNQSIDSYQKDGYDVEVQYRVVLGSISPRYSAIVIARNSDE